MFSHLGWALFLTSITASLHGLCTAVLMLALFRLSRRHAGRPVSRTDHLFLLSGLVVALLLVHCLEALVWAVYYVHGGGLPNMETALYFSLTSYATIGYGDLVLKSGERLVGAVEGLAGTFMCGWSVALLVSVIQFIVKTMPDPAEVKDKRKGD